MSLALKKMCASDVDVNDSTVKSLITGRINLNTAYNMKLYLLQRISTTKPSLKHQYRDIINGIT